MVEELIGRKVKTVREIGNNKTSKQREDEKKIKRYCHLSFPITRVEAGSNTSTVTLRVVRGDEIGLKKAAP
jgi:hypothetical protein